MKTFDDNWEEIHRGRAWGSYPSEDVVRFMARNYYNSDRGNTRVLDLGCGGGANTWFLCNEGFDTYAVDGSASAVENTKSMLNNKHLSASVQVSDAANLPYENEFFDVVINNAVICCNTLENIERILLECKRVLKKGGSLFSSGDFNPRTTGYGTGEKVEYNTYKDMKEGNLPGVIHFFKKDELKDLYEKLGFSIISLDTLTRTERNTSMTFSYFMTHLRKSND
jgi:SAM-dependent methyltransferase